MNTERTIYAAEASKMLKAELRKQYPRAKFSVRLSRWTIQVHYTDGPPIEDVKRIARGYEGKGFDGMIDLEYGYDHHLCAVHGMLQTGSQGTEDSRGVRPAFRDRPCCDRAEAVNLCTDYVFVERDLSLAAKASMVALCNAMRVGPEMLIRDNSFCVLATGSYFYSDMRDLMDMVRAADLTDPNTPVLAEEHQRQLQQMI